MNAEANKANYSTQTSSVERALRVLNESGLGLETYANQIIALQKRLSDGRFHLAVLGQFKRGKSTLLNALLGVPVLPTAVLPLTAIPTWMMFGSSEAVEIKFLDGSVERFDAQGDEGLVSTLARYVTEKENPHNAKGVSEAVVFYPAHILSHGVVLIDTPGIGSTLQHNTDTTLRFLPQCDAAMFVVSADPPMTEAEQKFLKEIRTHVSRLFFVFNKVDYLDESERAEALAYFRRVLIDQCGIDADVQIFPVSAKLGLSAHISEDKVAWRESGVAGVERHLVEFLAKEKSSALREIVSRKTQNVVAEALNRLRLSWRSTQLPLEDLRSRLSAFDQWLIEMRQEQESLQDRLAGDRRRTSSFLQDHYQQVRQRIAEAMHDALNAAMQRAGVQPITDAILQHYLEQEIPVIFNSRLSNAITEFDQRLDETLRAHEKRAEAVIASIQEKAMALFDLSRTLTDFVDDSLRTRTPYWNIHRWDSAFGPLSFSMLDKFMPKAFRERRLTARYHEKIDDLVLINAGKLREALADRIDVTFSRFEKQLDERIEVAIASTHGVMDQALHQREQIAVVTTEQLQRLEHSINELEKCLSELLAGDLAQEAVASAPKA